MGDRICDCEKDDCENEEMTGEPQPDCDAGVPAEVGEEMSEWKKTLLALLTDLQGGPEAGREHDGLGGCCQALRHVCPCARSLDGVSCKVPVV
jgi:hypothetical protein